MKRASEAALTGVESPATEHLRGILARYDEALLRKVANQLLRLRMYRPADELVERLATGVCNAVLIDRKFKEMDAAARGLLALVAQSRQPHWRLGGLLELASGLDAADGMSVVFQLFEAGLLFPDVTGDRRKLKSFEEWLGRGAVNEFRVFSHPDIAARAFQHELTWPEPPAPTRRAKDVHEADGLEVFLRLGVLWQQVKALPLRLTQQGEFFKRDSERLRSDPLLAGDAPDSLIELADPGCLLVGLAVRLGILKAGSEEIVAGTLPASWEAGLAAALAELWAALPGFDSWNAAQGWRGLKPEGATPYASAGLLALALLGRLGPNEWLAPEDVADWIAEHHCYWKEQEPRPKLRGWAKTFLLGLAYQLRLVQAAKEEAGRWVVRLSPLGRHTLGMAPAPETPAFPKTLAVQPNLEIVAYRQGLTPALIARLSGFCLWKSLGSACTLQLQPESVYQGLETGSSLEEILHVLQQHGVRETPAAVVQALKTWANKRDRISVYPAATLLEFPGPAEADQALGRGLRGVRLAERLVLMPAEEDIDFSHFRLLGTRDYALPPDPCVEVGSDGVTLTIDVARADLLLETEMQRFAEPAGGSPSANGDGRRRYQLTPTSLTRGHAAGLSVRSLEEWFLQRTGQPPSPAARLLLGGTDPAPITVENVMVLHVPQTVLADGLMQWPVTRALIQLRLGPQALAVAPENLEALKACLRELQLRIE